MLPAISQLLDYCRRHDWAGYDPYDGLNSRLFQATPFRHSAFARLALIQFLKRCPINLRPLIGVPPRQNPKGLALFASAAVRLHPLGLVEPSLAQELVDQLLALRSPGFDSLCWGYPFDWQNRHFMLPKFHPNIICSTFGGNALLDVFAAYGSPALLTAATNVGQFILTGLQRTVAGSTFCFSYTPLDRGQVHNANLLGAAYLARLWQHIQREELQAAALAAARFTVDRQRSDGSWVYGESPNQQWVDGFHTGYNLVALHRLHQAFREPWIQSALVRGYDYYRRHFFAPGGVAKYYHDRAFPLDVHSTAQGIITLVELATFDSNAIQLAGELFGWAHQHMRAPEGYYYFQRHRWWTNRIPYMRWSQAWMLLALTTLATASLPPAATRLSSRVADALPLTPA